MKVIGRCPWAQGEQYIQYHDQEWGVPVHDDRLLFEYLTLEGAQAGLSWITILKKRANYRDAFDQFDPSIVATYDEQKFNILMADAGIVEDSVDHRQCQCPVDGPTGVWEFRCFHLAICRSPPATKLLARFP